MEDPKVLFSDTTARRAQLMAATERLKTTITDEVKGMKDDATEVGKTTALVAGAALAVYLIANAILPKSDEYRYAEKYGEPDEDEDEHDDEDERDNRSSYRLASAKKTDKKQKSGAVSGLIGGLLTSVLTNIAREQLSGFLARIRQNNAINPAAEPRQPQYHERATTHPADYTPQS